MTQRILNVAQPIITADGTMSQVFAEWTRIVSNNLPLIGTGTPEGVIEAPQYSVYIDEAVPLTPVTYRKMLPILTGDRSKGWAIV